MATQTVEFIAASGLTLTAKLFAVNNDTVVQTASAVAEEANRKSVYLATFTDVPAGTYQIIGFSSGLPVANWEVDLTLTTATFRAYDPINPVAIRNAVGLANADLDAQLDALYNNSITTVLPVFAQTPTRIQNSDIQLFCNEELQLTVPIVDANNDLIDLTGKTLKIIIENILGQDLIVVNDGDITKSSGNVIFDVGTEVTGNTGTYRYSVRDITGSQNVVLCYGVLDVRYEPEFGASDSGNYSLMLPEWLPE